jgi:hypothetical protein
MELNHARRNSLKTFDEHPDFRIYRQGLHKALPVLLRNLSTTWRCGVTKKALRNKLSA